MRERGVATPVLVLTARDALDDRVTASTAAPTTIWSSHLPLRRLLARMRALVRRGRATEARRLSLGAISTWTWPRGA